MAEMMSKMMGQLAWEKHAVAGGKTEKEAREAPPFFIKHMRGFLSFFRSLG